MLARLEESRYREPSKESRILWNMLDIQVHLIKSNTTGALEAACAQAYEKSVLAAYNAHVRIFDAVNITMGAEDELKHAVGVVQPLHQSNSDPCRVEDSHVAANVVGPSVARPSTFVPCHLQQLHVASNVSPNRRSVPILNVGVSVPPKRRCVRQSTSTLSHDHQFSTPGIPHGITKGFRTPLEIDTLEILPIFSTVVEHYFGSEGASKE
ncbi:hypothetical protein Tco_1144263 [Tanacetum coccineum]